MSKNLDTGVRHSHSVYRTQRQFYRSYHRCDAHISAYGTYRRSGFFTRNSGLRTSQKISQESLNCYGGELVCIGDVFLSQSVQRPSIRASRSLCSKYLWCPCRIFLRYRLSHSGDASRKREPYSGCGYRYGAHASTVYSMIWYRDREFSVFLWRYVSLPHQLCFYLYRNVLSREISPIPSRSATWCCSAEKSWHSYIDLHDHHDTSEYLFCL